MRPKWYRDILIAWYIYEFVINITRPRQNVIWPSLGQLGGGGGGGGGGHNRWGQYTGQEPVARANLDPNQHLPTFADAVFPNNLSWNKICSFFYWNFTEVSSPWFNWQQFSVGLGDWWLRTSALSISWTILCMRSANERRCYSQGWF